MDTAYANIGLDANTTWRDAPGDAFQKSSDKLWVKLNYLKEKKHHQVGEKGKVVTVRDVIPQSKLARYGQYLYDNGREMMYNREKPFQFLEDHDRNRFRSEELPEPWMLTDVEHEFRRLTRNCSQPYDLYYGFKPIDCVQVEESIQQKYPVLAKKCQPHPIDSEETLETICLPNPFYRIDDLNQLELQMRITSTKHLWESPIKSLMYLVNTQKYIHQFRRGPFSDAPYTVDRPPSSHSALPPPTSTSPPSPPSPPLPLSPSSPPPRSSPPPPPSPPLPPLAALPSPFQSSPLPCTFRIIESLADVGVRHSVRVSSKSSTENREIMPAFKKRSPAEGQDFANLTLLTRPVNRREIAVADRSTLQVPDTVLKWLQTGYPTRSKEFSAIQNLSDELRSVRFGLQGSTISTVARDRQGRYLEEAVAGRKYDAPLDANVCNNNLEHSLNLSENQSASLSSSSSSDQNRSFNAKLLGKSRFPTAGGATTAKLSHSSGAAQCTGPSTFWQVQASSLWTGKPFVQVGTTPSDKSLMRDDGTHERGRNIKYRAILNSQYREEEGLSFLGGFDNKRSVCGVMAEAMKAFDAYEGNAFDDLERQAIEQWPSDDSVDIFPSQHLQ